jgi:hypothetical protein
MLTIFFPSFTVFSHHDTSYQFGKDWASHYCPVVTCAVFLSSLKNWEDKAGFLLFGNPSLEPFDAMPLLYAD